MRKKCVGFNPGDYRVIIEFITPKGNTHKGVYCRPYFTNNDAQQAIKEALLQPDITAAYCYQELIPIFE